jgi:hypothetical protein
MLKHHYCIYNENEFCNFKKKKKNSFNVWSLEECVKVAESLQAVDNSKIQIIIDGCIILHYIVKDYDIKEQIINSLILINHSKRI